MIEIVADQGINANGDLYIAKKLIDIVSSAGIDYVKFQKRTIDLVYTKEELDKSRESPWGMTTREQKEGLEFDEFGYLEIHTYCKDKNMKWFASPWDIESVYFLRDFNIPFIKIPSALITDKEFLKVCRDIGKPIILSSGMSTLEMVDDAVKIIGEDLIYSIMHCTSTYPTNPDDLNMTCIGKMKERYPWTKIGFSNHYPGLMAMTMAMIMGAEMIELHVTLDRTMYGSDQPSSIEPQGIFKLMEYKRLIEKMKGDGIKRIFESEIPIMKKLRR